MSFKFAFWAIGALVLFAAEAMAPGAFMLWFGFAAVAMALVVLVAPGLGWLAQAVLFSVLALISVRAASTAEAGRASPQILRPACSQQ